MDMIHLNTSKNTTDITLSSNVYTALDFEDTKQMLSVSFCCLRSCMCKLPRPISSIWILVRSDNEDSVDLNANVRGGCIITPPEVI